VDYSEETKKEEKKRKRGLLGGLDNERRRALVFPRVATEKTPRYSH